MTSQVAHENLLWVVVLDGCDEAIFSLLPYVRYVYVYTSVYVHLASPTILVQPADASCQHLTSDIFKLNRQYRTSG